MVSNLSNTKMVRHLALSLAINTYAYPKGWPSVGIRFKPGTNTSHYLNVLTEASAASGGKFDVYTHDTMPDRWHFAHNDRIAPIYVVPHEGYALTDHIENGNGMNKGVRITNSCLSVTIMPIAISLTFFQCP